MSEEIEPRRDLEFYLADHVLNTSISQAFDEVRLVDPLAAFNFFYDLLQLVKESKTLEAIKRINQIEPGGLQLLFIYYLRERVRDDETEKDDSQKMAISAALQLLNKEYERLEQLFPPDLFPLDDDSVDARARYAVALHEMTKETLNRMVDKMMKEAEEKRNIELRARQDERERLEKEFLPQIQNLIASTTSKSNKNPEFTTNRQVLALCFMLKHLGLRNIDKTIQARFIEFLTGKNYKKIYDSVREVDDIVFIKGGEDAKYIKEWFEKLGLTEIVKELNKMLDK